MAKPADSAVVNLDDSDLQFSTTHTFSNQPDSALDEQDEMLTDDRTGLLQSGSGSPNRSSGSGAKYNFLSVEFYQQFFDVDTEDVKGRVLAAMIPSPKKSFLQDVVQKKPDLYGPIWICATLVICVAVAGNLASYFQTSLAGDDFQWHYDFHKVTLAATAVFSYAWLVPSGLYAYLWWTSNAGLASLSFLELICLYGYSLVIYIPVSLLWLIQNNFLQWLLVLVGAGMSGAVLVLTLWPIFKENANRTSLILIGVIIGLHLLLACGFMLYFFHVPGGSSAAPVNDIKENIAKIETAPESKDDEKNMEEEKTKEDSKEKRTTGEDDGDEEEDDDDDENKGIGENETEEKKAAAVIKDGGEIVKEENEGETKNEKEEAEQDDDDTDEKREVDVEEEKKEVEEEEKVESSDVTNENEKKSDSREDDEKESEKDEDNDNDDDVNENEEKKSPKMSDEEKADQAHEQKEDVELENQI